jgi:protein gp37
LANVWLGVSVEDQQRAGLRVPALLSTPAAVRWLSCEPLLGPVDLSRWVACDRPWSCGDLVRAGFCDCPAGGSVGVDWVVAGGESGPGARPMHPDWVRSLRDQCAAAGVPFFFKQWGEWAPAFAEDPVGTHVIERDGHAHGRLGEAPAAIAGRAAHVVARLGKKAAGRELDGRTHDAYPAGHAAAAEEVLPDGR